MMLVKHEQPLKQSFPKLVTELGIVVFLQPLSIVFVAVWMMALQFSRESKTLFPDSTTILSKPEQSLKQCSPKLVTELGIVMLVKLLHQEKHHSPKLVTELGIVMLVKPLQSLKQYAPKLVTE